MGIKRVLWIDDDIESSALRPYIDELYENEFVVEKIKNPDDLDNISDDDWTSFSAILIDVIMPTGYNIDCNQAKDGMQTGFIVLKKLIDKEQLKTVPLIIFTIVEDMEIIDFCNDHNISLLNKQDYMFDTFVEKIIELTSNEKEQ